MFRPVIQRVLGQRTAHGWKVCGGGQAVTVDCARLLRGRGLSMTVAGKFGRWPGRCVACSRMCRGDSGERTSFWPDWKPVLLLWKIRDGRFRSRQKDVNCSILFDLELVVSEPQSA